MLGFYFYEVAVEAARFLIIAINILHLPSPPRVELLFSEQRFAQIDFVLHY